MPCDFKFYHRDFLCISIGHCCKNVPDEILVESDKLFSNLMKYSPPSTRLYLTLYNVRIKWDDIDQGIM